MKLIDSAIERPVSVIVGILLIALFGILALVRIPVQLTPDVDRPIVTVTTFWPGASPEEIEQEIIQRQEERLKSVEGLDKMTSESADSRGVVTLEFSVGQDPDALLLLVSNKLDQVRGYPLDADKPILSSGAGGNTGAITWLILNPLPERRDDIDIEVYRDFAEDVIKAAVERVDGVSQSNVYGGFERELQVIVDPAAMASHGVTVSQMMTAIRAENANISAGAFDEGKRRYIVRTVGQYLSAEDVEHVVVRADANGSHLRVGDLARAELGFKKAAATVRYRGRTAIAVNAARETGANVLTVMEGIRAVVAELNEGALSREGLYLEQVYDETDYIYSAISLVRNNIFVGGALATLVLLLFLRSASSVLIIVTSIPISIVGTFLVMSMAGRNINVISLAGMAFAVGMVVDNAIVALENIFRHRQMGKPRVQAALDGAIEVWGALLASTLTTIAIFLPIVFIEDEAGQLFRDIAIAVSSSVALSLIVAITVIPMMSARLGAIREETDVSPGDATSPLLERIGASVRTLIADSVYKISGSVAMRIGVVVLLVGASLAAAWGLLPKAEYLPTGNRNLVFGILLPPPGYNLDELIDVGQQIEGALQPRWDAEPGSPEAAALDDLLIPHMFYVAFGRSAFMGARTDDPDRVKELIPLIQGPVFSVPGMIAIVRQSGLFSGFSGGRAIDIEIMGPDLERLIGLAGQVFGQVGQVVPGAQSRPIPSLDLGNPEVRVIPNRLHAAEVGLSAQEIGVTVNAMMDGALVDGFQYEGEEIDLSLRGDSDWFRTQDIGQLPLLTPSGRVVPLNSVADVVVTSGPEQINHIERFRAITIRVAPPEEMPLETALENIETQIVEPLRSSGQLRPPYDVVLSGTADDLRKTREALQWNFLLALVITYLLMASLFESFLFPVVILLSVPPALAGGILGLAAVNALISLQPLDVLTMLGFVILIGVVVNAAILIVHQTLNILESEPDLERREAIRRSVASRVRPIFMSTITSALGMLPLVLFPGAGSELYRGLGSVVIGGLVVSTVFTLFLVPTFLSLAMDGQAWLKERRA
ncbi:MAG: efflux RND transporter permease subunit [Gemmatimonadetes bacterium]|nr:efflux RND transporter permease subunit [Gemmatimonadota bacterium]MBT5060130.1 efflux RND transporter permease subunit [Gemmatimonadota bacterium]MBT5143760.1 efflux RND transporter permease subunit [Gemmatimonadota bacterium]MBT5590527.1 efflux RND transporter permease subunit [Gemmatimonadota bacterium]MBT5965602.1 efflux RND transporter permease subunit [Gemmatimonadota bacterium]